MLSTSPLTPALSASLLHSCSGPVPSWPLCASVYPVHSGTGSMEGSLACPFLWRNLEWQSSSCLSCVKSCGKSHYCSAWPCFLQLDVLGGSGVGGALGQRGTWVRGGKLSTLTAPGFNCLCLLPPFLDQERLPENSAGDRHAQSGASPHCGYHVQRLW